MRLAIGHENYFGPWAATHIPHLFLEHLGPYVSFGVIDKQGTIRGVALYHGYSPQFRSIEISFALETPRWISKSVIAGIMAYPFDQLDLLRVSAVTPRSAASARRFLQTFGFKQEGLVRNGFGTYGDAVIHGLTPDDWKASRFNPRRRLDGEEVHPRGAPRA